MSIRTLNFEEFISYLGEISDDQRNILQNKRLTDDTPVFQDISLYEAYDLISMVRRLSDIDQFVQYIQDNEFDSPEDIILEFPGAFENERNNYEIRRKEEEMTTAVTDAIYKCERCDRPVISRTIQTRSGDEGATVYISCQVCNITRRV